MVDLDLQTLRWFVAVAEAPSFSKAAASIGIARPRLSAAMLELETDGPLFDREAGGTALTAEGRRLLEEARVRIAAAADLPELAGEPVEADLRPAEEPSVFPISIVVGVTVSKWTTRWEERNPARPVVVTVLRDEDQLTAVRDGSVACAFVRLPMPADDLSATRLHAIPLYTEARVVVAAKGHLIEAADEVELADLAGDRLLSAPATLPGWADVATDPGTEAQRAHLHGLTPEQLIEVVATGAGIAVLPASVVRAHGRKDVLWRPLSDPPQSTVAVVWRAGDDSIDTERFVGIVRGRTERSSRAEPTPPTDKRKSSTVRQRSASSHAARRKRR